MFVVVESLRRGWFAGRGEGDEGVGALIGGVFGVADGLWGFAGLDAENEGGAVRFGGFAEGGGAGEPFLFGEGGPFAGELGPDEAVDAGFADEVELGGEGVEVEEVGVGEGGLGYGEDAAERFSFGGWLGVEEDCGRQ